MSEERIRGSESCDRENCPQKDGTTAKKTDSDEQQINVVQYNVPVEFRSLERKVPDFKHQNNFARGTDIENQEDHESPVERYLPGVFGNLRRKVPDPKHQRNYISRLDDDKTVSSVSSVERYQPRVFGNLKRETHNATRQENSAPGVGPKREERRIDSLKRYFSLNGMHTRGSDKKVRVRPVSVKVSHQWPYLTFAKSSK